MVHTRYFIEHASSFHDVVGLPHGGKTSFRIHNRIFATLDVQSNLACLKLTPVEQSVFVPADPKAISPVPNAWGKQGWTYFKLDIIKIPVLHDALKCAYTGVRTGPTKKK